MKAPLITPGPWSFGQQSGKPDKRLGIGQFVNGRQLTEAELKDNPYTLPERVADCYGTFNVANAQAIAALPDLMEALRNILEDCKTANERLTPADWDFACHHAAEYARQALLKAGFTYQNANEADA